MTLRTLDCRLAQIQGFEAHKLWCDAVLQPFEGTRSAVVLPTREAGIYYCQYNFKFEPGDDYPLKMLQTRGYLHHAWSLFAGSHELRTIYCCDAATSAALEPSPSYEAHAIQFTTLDNPLPTSLLPPSPPSPPARATEAGGFMQHIKNYFLGPRDWVSQLESRLKPLAGDDLIDASVLPRPAVDLRKMLAKEFRETTRSGTSNDAYLTRLVVLSDLLSKCHPMTREVYFLQAQMFGAVADSAAETAISEHMTAWITHAQTARSTRKVSYELMGFSASIEGDAWDALIDLDDSTLKWRSHSEDPNFLIRHLAFKFPLIGAMVKEHRDKGHLQMLQLEYGQWLIECQEVDSGLHHLSRLTERMNMHESQSYELGVKALERICSAESERNNATALRAAVEGLERALGSECPRGDPTIWSEYRMRAFYWRAVMLTESGIFSEELWDTYRQARLFATDRVHRALRSGGFICYHARNLKHEAIAYAIALDDQPAGLRCAREAVEILEPLCLYKIKEAAAPITLDAIQPYFEACTLVYNIATKMGNENLGSDHLGKLVQALHAVISWPLYHSAMLYTEKFPNMPEARLEIRVNEWVAKLKSAIPH